MHPDIADDRRDESSQANADVPVGVGAREYAARPVDVGNPHAVALVEAGVLDDLDLEHEPSFPHDVFPRGVNREFVEHVASDVLRMRVTIREVRVSQSKPDRGIVRTGWEMFNQNDELVLTTEGTGMFRRRPVADGA